MKDVLARKGDRTSLPDVTLLAAVVSGGLAYRNAIQ